MGSYPTTYAPPRMRALPLQCQYSHGTRTVLMVLKYSAGAEKRRAPAWKINQNNNQPQSSVKTSRGRRVAGARRCRAGRGRMGRIRALGFRDGLSFVAQQVRSHLDGFAMRGRCAAREPQVRARVRA